MLASSLTLNQIKQPVSEVARPRADCSLFLFCYSFLPLKLVHELQPFPGFGLRSAMIGRCDCQGTNFSNGAMQAAWKASSLTSVLRETRLSPPSLLRLPPLHRPSPSPRFPPSTADTSVPRRTHPHPQTPDTHTLHPPNPPPALTYNFLHLHFEIHFANTSLPPRVHTPGAPVSSVMARPILLSLVAWCGGVEAGVGVSKLIPSNVIT